MTSTIRLRAALLACAVTIAGSAAAQSAREPRFTFDGSGTRVIEVSNLPGAGQEGCVRDTHKGRVTRRHVENGKITGVTLEGHGFINAPGAWEFENNAAHARVHDALSGMFVPGSEISIKSERCGAAGRMIYMDSVSLRNPGTAAGPGRAQSATGGGTETPTLPDDGAGVLLRSPGAVRGSTVGGQPEHSDAGGRAASAAPILPTRTAWKISRLDAVPFQISIASSNGAFRWQIGCQKTAKGTLSFDNWFLGPSNWRIDWKVPRISIDGVKTGWEVDGADEGSVFSDNSLGGSSVLSPHALSQIARGERLVVAGFDGRKRPRDAVFDISGGEALFASFQAKCQTFPRS